MQNQTAEYKIQVEFLQKMFKLNILTRNCPVPYKRTVEFYPGQINHIYTEIWNLENNPYNLRENLLIKF